MERRDFLRVSAAASSAAALWPPSAAEALPSLRDEGTSAAEMDRFLAHLDGVMRRSREHVFLEPFRPRRDGPPEPAAQVAERRQEELFGKALRSLMLVGSFQDLPERGRLHPGMQQRLWEQAPEVDEALQGMLDLLGGMSPAERLDLTQAFREQPDLSMRLCEALDAQAAHAGVSAKRRLHLRRMAMHLTWRMKHQSAATVIEDYVAQLRDATTRDGLGETLQRRVMATLGEEAFWQEQRRLAALALTWDRGGGVVSQADDSEVPGRGGPLPPRTVATFPAPASPPPPAQPRGRRVLRNGLIVLGVALGAGATGGLLLLVPGGIYGSLPLFTIGALLLLAGLITVIVGAAMGA